MQSKFADMPSYMGSNDAVYMIHGFILCNTACVSLAVGWEIPIGDIMQ
jgi:hypothetical protein